MKRCMVRFVLAGALLAALLGLGPLAATAGAGVAPQRVLILGGTVSGGIASEEAQKAVALGFEVDVVDDVTWAAMTAEQFGAYRAIVLGDATCSGSTPLAAEVNRLIWSPQVDGNVIINGTDPVFHSDQGGKQMTDSGIAFATSAAGKTGLYVSLSCYYDSVPALTPVAVLDQFGTFTVTGVGCFNDAHIVAVHPALAGLTDTSVSNWSCSVHEAFDSYPSSGPGAFTVLAIARGAAGVTYTAPDGSVGIPYILARGEGLVAGNISLNPLTATNPLGTTHTVTAFVASGGTPQSGIIVTFTVTAGPHAGTTGTGTTDANGNATFTYAGTSPGTDTLQASTGSGTATQTSNAVSKTWTGEAAPATVPATATVILPETGSAGGATAPLGLAAIALGLGLLMLARRPAKP